jgi:hypothetical protein
LKLPNAELAVVEREKILDYLLNPTHRYGASKARFFAAFGFTRENWQALASSLKSHGQANDVFKVKDMGFGPRYEIVGELATPDGRRPRVCSIWQVDKGHIAPRLITAYPDERL